MPPSPASAQRAHPPARKRAVCAAAAALCLLFELVALPAKAQTAATVAPSAQEAQAKQKLDAIRAEIKKIGDAQKETASKKTDADAALREQEVKIGATAKEIRALDQRLAEQQDKLKDLEAQRDALNQKLAAQRETLAALIRSAYALGRGEELKLILAQEDVTRIGRMLGYLRYFERERVAQIQGLLADLQALAQVRTAIEVEAAALASSRAQRQADVQQLDGERVRRQQVLEALERELKDDQVRLGLLGKDEKELTDLLSRLRDVFADIPKQIAGAEPFGQLRGRLNWPVRGKLGSPFGAKDGDRSSNGIVIVAAEGSEVRAVSHGRVVFADWMRGFGLLVILDHGDGFMSLYGYNEALFKDVGDWVNANEAIASSGASGGQKTPGVYFELRAQGKPIDPRGWLKP